MPRLYETPRHVTDVAECRFYHAMDLPVSGFQAGAWDLRDRIDEYIPALDYAGASVLDVGASSGFLSFEFERRGARVVAFDRAHDVAPDIVPFHDLDAAAAHRDLAPMFEKTKNGFWLAHRELGSSVRAVYGHANAIPEALGPVDIAFFGNILQHLRDPFGAITSAAALARRIVVTEAFWRTDLPQDEPLMYFLPAMVDAEAELRAHSWWQVSAALVERWLSALGYRVEGRSRHEQLFVETGDLIPHYTVVASRPER
ncbi:MAG TPA: hypothetical protein VD790_02265 [Thermoleophilaceae bacterium]|nr:hypothetical protein [Thermoleophilaceae bacterium]